MQRFVHDQNLARYIDLLESELDPATRQQLHKLLVEEEDRFGSLGERLNQTDRLVARCTARLNEQKALVFRLRENGCDARLSESLLTNMTVTLELVVQYRQTILDGLDRNRL